MQLYRFLPAAALLLGTASPALLCAQFQEPTAEELKMTADPKAPGAAAVYLYREEKTDDNLHFHSYYVRLKVLTEKGKEAATVRIPYERGPFKVADVHGRTIHADGTVVPLTTKPSDLVEVQAEHLQVNTMVFTLPSVEVGSILEYGLQLRYDDNLVAEPTWEVQQPYFVHKAHYLFTPSKNRDYITDAHGDIADKLLYVVHANPGAKLTQDSVGRYSFDITDVPPVPKDDWMPPLNSLNWRVEFYYSSSYSQKDFWQSAGKRWAKEAEHFANPSAGLQRAASELVAPTDDEAHKARKLYDAVMKLENTSFTREKSKAERKAEKLKEAKDAEMVWNQKSGSANELALLYVALARAAGLQAFPMEVVNRDRALFDPSYLSTYQLDDYIAIVVVNGKEEYLDPGEKMCPYGLLHWTHAIAAGIRLTAKGPDLAGTPSNLYTQNVVQRIGDLTIAEDGSVHGTLRYILAGQQALHWRQLAIQKGDEEVKKQFNEAMREYLPDGVNADFDRFLALDDYNTNLIGSVKVSGVLGSATGKHFFLPGVFFEARAPHSFVAEDKRATPVDVQYPKRIVEDVTYRLPASFTVESAPQQTAVPWGTSAVMKLDSQTGADQVRVVRNLAYNFTVLDPKDYAPLHDFYQKIAAADQQQLVLSRVQTAQKGN